MVYGLCVCYANTRCSHVIPLIPPLLPLLREQKILIRRSDIDEIVAQTMATAQPKHPSLLSYEEYRALVGDKTHMLAQLTINISGYVRDLYVYANMCMSWRFVRVYAY
ncbi:hypothetical protein EON65_13935 [archaeon]|nr:MAG: hypothetical protein EON65_13935 [archaeon]